MQRGVVVAANTGTPGTVDRSLHEVGKYLYRFGGPPSSQYVVVNIDAFDELPDAYKRALMLAGWNLTDRGRHTVREVDGEAVAIMKAAGVEEFQIPDDQRVKLQELARPLWETWASETENNKRARDGALHARQVDGTGARADRKRSGRARARAIMPGGRMEDTALPRRHGPAARLAQAAAAAADGALAATGGVANLAMTALVTVDVVGRYAFGSPLGGALEFSGYCSSRWCFWVSRIPSAVIGTSRSRS